MTPLFCFIDDAEFELRNFREHAAGAFAPARVVYASTFDQAVAAIGEGPVVGFLLDIYGADPEMDQPRLPDERELAGRVGSTGQVAALYQDLGQGPEAFNTFLRRLYGRVQVWQEAFGQAARGLGQGRAYGLYNLARAREHFPWAACLGYSRKALYADGAAMTAAGAEGVLQKPQGNDDAAIAEATRRQAPELAKALARAVDRRLAAALTPLAARWLAEPASETAGRQVLAELAALAGGGAGEGADWDLVERAAARAGLRAGEAAGLRALRAWRGARPAG